MKVFVDTNVVLGLVSRHDQHHRQATLLYGELASKQATLLLPRIARIEFIGHATRFSNPGFHRERVSETRISMLESMASLEMELVDHAAEDYSVAETWWRQYSDWPIDYPDALIAATAVRLKADRLWTFDQQFGRLLIKWAPGIELVRSLRPG